MYLLFMEARPDVSTSVYRNGCKLVRMENGPLEAPVRSRIAELATSPIHVPGLENVTQRGLPTFLSSHGIELGKYQDVEHLTAFSSIPLDLKPPVEYHLEAKAPGSYKAFQEARKRGEIVVKPLRRVTMSASDSMVTIDAGTLVGSSTLLWGGIPGGLKHTTSECNGKFFHRLHMMEMPFPFASDPAKGQGGTYGSHVGGYYRLRKDVSVDSLFSLYGSPNLEVAALKILSLPMPANLQNDALNELHEGIYDLLTELGELPETVGYIYSSLRRIIQLFLGMKSKEVLLRKKFKGKELIDELTGLWMSFRYAAGPIGYSIEDSLKLLDERNTPYVTVRKRMDAPFDFTIGGYRFHGTAEHRCFAKGRVNLQSGLRGLNLNLARTVWELTPLSFVMNWVLPIGSILGALSPPTSMTQRVLTHSVRVRDLSIEHTETGVSVTNETNIYGNVVLQPRVSLNVGPKFFMNWKRSLDAFSLSWGMFLNKYWKSYK